MLDPKVLKEDFGWHKRGELHVWACENGFLDEGTYTAWLDSVLTKLRPLFVEHYLAVRPIGFKRHFMYSCEVALFTVALTEFQVAQGRQLPVDECIDFFFVFFSRSKRGRQYLPESMQDSKEFPVTALVRTSDRKLRFRVVVPKAA